MTRTATLCLLAALAMPAWAKKDCNELKAEIEAKLKAKGVGKYSLEIVPASEAKGGREVGACDGGAKRIVYKRG
jgi:hypothetical protein